MFWLYFIAQNLLMSFVYFDSKNGICIIHYTDYVGKVLGPYNHKGLPPLGISFFLEISFSRKRFLQIRRVCSSLKEVSVAISLIVLNSFFECIRLRIKELSS